MGATSVTGTGRGSVDTQKGSERTSMGVGGLIGPHVIAAGTATLSTNVVTFQVPLPTNLTAHYVVLATTLNATTANAVAVTSFAVDTTTKEGTIALKGAGASDVIYWAVIRVGVS